MEAKDTVMNDMLIKVWVLEFIQPGELDFNAKLKEFAQAQAEISFKVGADEVMNWLHSPCPHTGGLEERQMYVQDCPICWQAFKESRGIK